MMKTIEDPALRRERARRTAERAEMEYAATDACRPDLLLRAARSRLAAGDADIAKALLEAVQARADDDATFAPPWVLRQARDLLELIDRNDGVELIRPDGSQPRLR